LSKATWRLVVAAVVVLGLSGCMRGCTSSRPPFHLNPNMDQQPKYRAQEASDFFYDGATMRIPVAGTVARGELREDVAFFEGKDEAAGHVTANPLTAGLAGDELEAVLDRGHQRYEIYCTPCHAANGNGKGMLWDRAQIQAGDLRQERLAQAPEGELFDVVTNGLGLMQGYRYPIPARDRWAIVAYVRELQAGRGR
jgi:mono/diheme cytochrome c family protein